MNYKFAENWAFNFNTGIFYQLPAYTSLGLKLNDALVNENTLKYIRNAHLVGGLEFNGKDNLRITVEGYYKKI